MHAGGEPAAAQDAIAQLASEFFCEHIELVDVIMRVIKEIPHHFKGGGVRSGRAGSNINKPRHQLGKARGEIRERFFRGIGEDVAELGNRMDIAVFGEVAGIHGKALG